LGSNPTVGRGHPDAAPRPIRRGGLLRAIVERVTSHLLSRSPVARAAILDR
jgi:hypothetical protein